MRCRTDEDALQPQRMRHLRVHDLVAARLPKHVSCMPAACAMQEFNKDTVWGGEAHQVSATFTPMTLLRLSFLPCAATLQAMQAMQLSQDMDSSRYKRRQASCAQCELRTRLHPGLSSCPAALCCRTSWQLCRKSCGGSRAVAGAPLARTEVCSDNLFHLRLADWLAVR